MPSPAEVPESHEMRVLEQGKGIWDVIREIAHSGVQDDTFYVLDVDDIVRKHTEWKLKMPRVTPFYAVKCNDHRVVLQTLASIGASFDCASKNEISKVLDLGVKADRILYANTSKQISHIRFAAESNVNVMTFDNESELLKVKELHPSAKMILRVRCDAKIANYPFGNKFGVFPNDAPPLFALAKILDIDLVGISFHVGSLCGEPEVFDRCITIGRQLFDLAAKNYGFNMTILDLGGGYPGHRGSSIDQIATIINKSLERHFPEGCGVNIIAEPGRYYVCSAFTLATRIHGRRACISDGESPTTSYYYYINDGVYGSFMGPVIDKVEVTPQLLEQRPGPNYNSTIWGPSCCGFDRIPNDFSLPEMNIGNWLIFEDMGAYTLSMAGNFNGFPIPEVFPVVKSRTYI